MPWCASLLWLLVLVYNYTSDLHGDPSPLRKIQTNSWHVYMANLLQKLKWPISFILDLEITDR